MDSSVRMNNYGGDYVGQLSLSHISGYIGVTKPTLDEQNANKRHIASPHEGTDCGNVVSDADRQSPGNRIAPNDANSGTVSSVTLEMSARPVEGVLRKREGSLPDLRGYLYLISRVILASQSQHSMNKMLTIWSPRSCPSTRKRQGCMHEPASCIILQTVPRIRIRCRGELTAKLLSTLSLNAPIFKLLI
ncbi:hypothetical protein Tcan_18348 [Toxocara canis]|uniref:Uncharacterized protein n=1 Tax=Toxocara canis TaxID=6265 RepID=A0A0B2V1X4_TOXCA|nr:hypothetical protein Tcan_18348 [Toxocara canis]